MKAPALVVRVLWAALAALAALAVATVLAVVTQSRVTKARERFSYIPETCQSRCSQCQRCRGGGGGSGGQGVSTDGLPPPSAADQRCQTNMVDNGEDNGECFALVYHECPTYGRTDESMIPPRIRDMKEDALQQIYELNIDCTSEEGAGHTKVPEYKCFTRPPRTWSSVCVARPDRAGRGKCKFMKRDEWRVFVQGEDPLRTIMTCAGEGADTPPSLYLKSHFRGTRILEDKTGRVGHA